MAVSDADKAFRKKEDFITAKLDRMDKDIRSLERDMLNLIYEDYVSQFDFDEAGNLKATAKNTNLANKLNKFLNQFSDEFLQKLNTNFGKDLLRLTVFAKDYYKGFDIEEKTLGKITESLGYIENAIGFKNNKIIPNSYLDKLGQLEDVKKRIANYVVGSVANKKGFKDFSTGFSEIVKGTKEADGVLTRYYKQYAWDTWNNVDATINKHYAENLDLKYFIYAGSLITTSRPFCIKRAGKVFSIKETEKWKCDPDLIGKPKGSKCDDSYNPLIERGRYNCRHYIKYVPDEYACKHGKTEACEENK